MPKIFNAFLKDSELMTSNGRVTFNKEGIADVQDQETADLLLSLANYHLVEEEEPKKEEPKEELPKEDTTETVEEKVEEKEAPKEAPKKKATK